jgi:hypothetical protein
MRFTRLVRARARDVLALLLCGAFSACDVRDLTAPTPAVVTGSPRAASASGGIALGTATVAPPPNTSPAEVSKLGYYELGIALPESTWVMVHVSGGVNLLWNPACADMPPNWPCMDNSPTTSYGESPGFGGPVQLFNVANGVSSAVRLRGSGGAGTTPASAVGVFFQRRPGPLVGHVSMTAVYAHNSINGGGTPSWLVTGGYTVTATQIEAPFTVTESAPEPDGTRTYTAEPLPGLRFSNFPTSGQFPPGAAFWSFYPDDSPPERNWPGWQVPGCQYQLVCRYKPPVPGRMQVNAFVEWQRAIVRSKPLGEPGECSTATALRAGCSPTGPDLQVACSAAQGPGLVRGDTVDCVTTVVPAQEFTVTIRQASGSGFTVADTPNVHHASGEADHWRGVAVANSRVKVMAEVIVNGAVRKLDKEARFVVSPRRWNVYRITNPAVVYGLVPGGAMSPAPDSAHQTYGAFDLTHYRTDSTTVAVVDAGPNRGLAFYRDQIPFDENGAYIWIHPALFPLSAGHYPPHSDYERWYNDQDGQGTGTCTSAGMGILAVETMRHEGATSATVSHLGVANQFFAADRLDVRFERLYRVGEEKLREDAFRLYGRWKAGGYRSSQNAFDAADRPKVWAAVGCTLDLFVNDAH